MGISLLTWETSTKTFSFRNGFLVDVAVHHHTVRICFLILFSHHGTVIFLLISDDGAIPYNSCTVFVNDVGFRRPITILLLFWGVCNDLS